jgi:hypothetical protein
MIKNWRLILSVGFFAILTALSGCGESGYNPKPILLPPHIQKIAVRPFANKTQFYGLEERLMLRLSEEFIRDGRLPLVNNENEADGVVAGEIVRYIREPISYDVNHVVEEYKLWVVINMRFIDRVNKVALWEEPRLEQTYRYFVDTKPGGITEEEARERLWELFGRDIVKRTIEGFGSVSGASQRKVSDKPAVVPSTTTAPSQPFVVPPSPY